jgi:hypothetical protein
MDMKLAPALAGILGLALAPVAYAQVDCGEIRRVMAEAENDFDDIAGDEIGDEVNESRYRIGGAKECAIDFSSVPIYFCLFQHDQPSSAFSAYKYRLGEVRRCLSDWKQTAVREERPLGGDGYRDLEGVRFGGPGAKDFREWSVIVEQHIVGGRAHYHVRIAFEGF